METARLKWLTAPSGLTVGCQATRHSIKQQSSRGLPVFTPLRASYLHAKHTSAVRSEQSNLDLQDRTHYPESMEAEESTLLGGLDPFVPAHDETYQGVRFADLAATWSKVQEVWTDG